MAKSLRSRSGKVMKGHLRRKVFGPVEAERIARLSAIQQEIAARKLESPEMDVDESKEAEQPEPAATADEEAMEVDGAAPKSVKKSASKVQKKQARKKRARKPRNSMVFTSTKKSKKDKIGRA